MARRGVYSLKVLPTKESDPVANLPGEKKLEMRGYEGKLIFIGDFYITTPLDVPYILGKISDEIRKPRP